MSSVKLYKWFVVVEGKEYMITEQQKDNILNASTNGTRFIQIEKAVINIAFISRIFRRIEYADSIEDVSKADKKFLLSKEQLEAKKNVKQLPF